MLMLDRRLVILGMTGFVLARPNTASAFGPLCAWGIRMVVGGLFSRYAARATLARVAATSRSTRAIGAVARRVVTKRNGKIAVGAGSATAVPSNGIAADSRSRRLILKGLEEGYSRAFDEAYDFVERSTGQTFFEVPESIPYMALNSTGEVQKDSSTFDTTFRFSYTNPDAVARVVNARYMVYDVDGGYYQKASGLYLKAPSHATREVVVPVADGLSSGRKVMVTYFDDQIVNVGAPFMAG